jgi:hypothetical protein
LQPAKLPAAQQRRLRGSEIDGADAYPRKALPGAADYLYAAVTDVVAQQLDGTRLS